MNWDLYMLLPFPRLCISQKPKSVVSQQHPLDRAVCLRKVGFHRARDKQDTRMLKSSAQFYLSPPAQQLLDRGQELTELREVNLKIFFFVYFIYLLLLNKCYSNSDIFDLSFTAQINY